MAKAILMLVCLAGVLGVTAAQAQEGMPGNGDPAFQSRGSTPSNTRFLATTGATVPRPDLLPSDPPKLGRSSYDRDKRIERSICSNC
jgi:hypothetical protein